MNPRSPSSPPSVPHAQPVAHSPSSPTPPSHSTTTAPPPPPPSLSTSHLPRPPIRSVDDLCAAITQYPEICSMVTDRWEKTERRVWGYKAKVGRVREIIGDLVEAAAENPEIPHGVWTTDEAVAEIGQCFLDIITDSADTSDPYLLASGLRLVFQIFGTFSPFELDSLLALYSHIDQTVLPALLSHPALWALRDTLHPLLIPFGESTLADACRQWHKLDWPYIAGDVFLQALGLYNVSRLPGAHDASPEYGIGWCFWTLPWETYIPAPHNGVPWYHPSLAELIENGLPTRITFGQIVDERDSGPYGGQYVWRWQDSPLSVEGGHGMMWTT